MEKTKWSTKNFFESLKYAINGVKYVFRSQRNILIQSVFTLIAVLCGIFFRISAMEWCILSITIALVIFAELMNTAIETTIDLVTEEPNEKAKIAKDVAAGAVLITAVNSIIVGLVIFAGKLINIFF